MSDLHDFKVTQTMTVSWTVTITAENADQAEERAAELSTPELCYGCSSPDTGEEWATDPDLSLDGSWETHDVEDEGPHDCGEEPEDCEHRHPDDQGEDE